jgi:hypothetical protein
MNVRYCHTFFGHFARMLSEKCGFISDSLGLIGLPIFRNCPNFVYLLRTYSEFQLFMKSNSKGNAAGRTVPPSVASAELAYRTEHAATYRVP